MAISRHPPMESCLPTLFEGSGFLLQPGFLFSEDASCTLLCGPPPQVSGSALNGECYKNVLLPHSAKRSSGPTLCRGWRKQGFCHPHPRGTLLPHCTHPCPQGKFRSSRLACQAESCHPQACPGAIRKWVLESSSLCLPNASGAGRRSVPGRGNSDPQDLPQLLPPLPQPLP